MSHEPAPRSDPDEFYVGYLPGVPRGIARTVRSTLLAVTLVSVVVVTAASMAFRSPSTARWSEDVVEYRGRLIASPYPMLWMADSDGEDRLAILVATGKRGVPPSVRDLAGKVVALRGTSLEHDGRRMIEIADGEPIIAEDGAVRAEEPRRVVIGPATLQGEIVDPKCFLGAMKPGDGKLHKGCAIRCIAGGIPPMLVSRNSVGAFSYYLLVDPQGGPANAMVLPYVAEQVEVSGTVERVSDLNILRIAVDGIRQSRTAQ